MRAVVALSWIELKIFLREPLTVVFTLALPPLVLYVLAQVFGNTPNPAVYGGAGPVDYYTPAYIGLVIASLGLVGLPVHLASYREHGVLRRMQAARVPVRALLASQLVVLFAGAAAGSVLIVVLARLSYGVTWPADWLGLAAAAMLGGFAFTAIGVLLGAALPTARAAQGIGVLLWFLMMMVAGAGPPREVLGTVLTRVADVTPLKPLVIALQDPWLGQGVNWTQMAVLGGIFLVAGGAAVPALRRRS